MERECLHASIFRALSRSISEKKAFYSQSNPEEDEMTTKKYRRYGKTMARKKVEEGERERQSRPWPKKCLPNELYEVLGGGG